MSIIEKLVRNRVVELERLSNDIVGFEKYLDYLGREDETTQIALSVYRKIQERKRRGEKLTNGGSDYCSFDDSPGGLIIYDSNKLDSAISEEYFNVAVLPKLKK